VQVVANGAAFVVEDGTTLDAFIRSRALDPRYVIAELNGTPVERARYSSIELSDGDRLELVRAVAGG